MKATIFLLMLIAFMPLTLADEIPIDEPKPIKKIQPIETEEVPIITTRDGKMGRCNLKTSDKCKITKAYTRVFYNDKTHIFKLLKKYPSLEIKNKPKIDARYIYGLYLDGKLIKTIELNEDLTLEKINL